RLILTATNSMSYDIVKNALGKEIGERKMRLFNAILVAIIGFSSLLIALTPQQMLAWIIWSGLALMANCFFFPIVLGLYWDRMTKNAARLSMLVGFIVTIVCFATYGRTIPIFGIPSYAAFPGFLASFLTAVVISLVEKKK
ncbi:MAG: proline permease, partial [Archaeoglobaceae archaeon]